MTQPLGIPPGPDGRGIRARLREHEYATDPVAYVSELFHRYGPVAGIHRGNRRRVFVFGAENNRAVLSQSDDFHTVLEYAIPPRIRHARRGIGLLNMNGVEHRVARKAIAPSFRPAAIGPFADIIKTFADDEIGSWRSGEVLDVSAAMRRLTLRVACRCFFGVDIRGKAGQLGRLVSRMLSLRYFASSIRYFPFDVRGAPFHRLLRTIRALDDALAAIVEERASRGDLDDDLLGMLIQGGENGAGFERDEIVGHLTTLIVAGHETTSNTLAWILLMLSADAECRNAVLAGLPAGINSPTLDNTIRETLRLLPPGPNTSRIVTRDLTLAGVDLPRGAQVTTSKFVTHRDPRVFPNPTRFMPNRWRETAPSLYEYHPYGAGAHACIGAAFADMEMKIIVTQVLSRYVLEALPAAPINRDVGLMMSVKGGLRMRVRESSDRLDPAELEGTITHMVRFDDSPGWRLGW